MKRPPPFWVNTWKSLLIKNILRLSFTCYRREQHRRWPPITSAPSLCHSIPPSARVFFLFLLLFLLRLGTGGCTHEDGSYLRSASGTRSTSARRSLSRFSPPSAFRPGLPFATLTRCPRLIVFAFTLLSGTQQVY